MLTVIVSLNCNESGLQLLGFNPFWYTRSGDGVVFRGQAQHRTVIISGTRDHLWALGGNFCTHTPYGLANAPVKLAMFFYFKRRA